MARRKVDCVLTDFNLRWSTPGLRWPLVCLVFVASSLFLVAHLHRQQTLSLPPETGGDALDYDRIAWSLATGQGFSRQLPSEEFEELYRLAGQSLLADVVTGPVTDRPPLYPVLLAVTFRQERQFVWIRVIQAIVMGLVIAGVFGQVYQRAGIVPALLCPMLMLIVDPRPRTMVREILTEGVACGLVTLLFLVLVSWDRKRQYRHVAFAGLVLGLMVLSRSMLVFWVPLLFVGMWASTERGSRWRALWQGAMLCVFALGTCIPWWVRNVQTLGEFRPLGLQGAEQLSAAYSDEAYTRKGMWFNLDESGFFASILEPDAVQRSLARAQKSQQAARSWVQQHPVKAALLWPMRVFQEFRPHGPGDLFVLAFAALGLVSLWHTSEGRIARWLILSQGLTVALTWSVAGRFVFPLLGVLHLLAAVGVWGAFVALVERRDISRGWVLLDPSTGPVTTG